MIIKEPPCYSCRHLFNFPDSCLAFPNGIPQDVQTGENQHDEPIDNDNGVLYEPFLSEDQLLKERALEILKKKGLR